MARNSWRIYKGRISCRGTTFVCTIAASVVSHESIRGRMRIQLLARLLVTLSTLVTISFDLREPPIIPRTKVTDR